jgi:hypothetical protein
VTNLRPSTRASEAMIAEVAGLRSAALMRR